MDFLAEEIIASPAYTGSTSRFEAFTAVPDHAVRKFRRVIERTDSQAPPNEQIFPALRQFVGAGHKLTLILANHDLELSLPAVREVLRDTLTQNRPARVEFIYDGEAYVRDNVVIEHGNRYDGWNAIAYGMLRAHRSLVSRSEVPYVRFAAPPGSQLVAEIMNPLKRHFKFIDLLKPENEALIPVLACLDPRTIRPLRTLLHALPFLVSAGRREPPVGQVPESAMNIAYSTTPASNVQFLSSIVGDPIDPATIDCSRKLLDEAEAEWQDDLEESADMHIASGGPTRRDRVSGCLAMIRQVLPFSHPSYRRLRKALLVYRQTLQATFNVAEEAPQYLEAARRLSGNRRLVVFGHTHLPKRIPLGTGLYLNSGTWCPTVQLPEAFYSPEPPDEQICAELKEFIEDLANNRTTRWCTLKTTFVKITQYEGQTIGELFEYHADGTWARC